VRTTVDRGCGGRRRRGHRAWFRKLRIGRAARGPIPYQPVVSGALRKSCSLCSDREAGRLCRAVAAVRLGAYQLADILLPIAAGGSLDRRVRAGLSNPLPGGVWALHLRGSPARQNLLDDYGLQVRHFTFV